MIACTEKCSLLVDSLRRTSECYIEVEQKGGGGVLPWRHSGYAIDMIKIQVREPLQFLVTPSLA